MQTNVKGLTYALLQTQHHPRPLHHAAVASGGMIIAHILVVIALVLLRRRGDEDVTQYGSR